MARAAVGERGRLCPAAARGGNDARAAVADGGKPSGEEASGGASVCALSFKPFLVNLHSWGIVL